MAQPAKHLRLVDEDGTFHEFDENCPGCVHAHAEIADLKDQLTGLQRDIRAEHARYEKLKRDKQQAAKDNKLWPEAVRLFQYWQEKCNHPRSKFGAQRFAECEWFIREYGPMMCRRAIDGAAFAPFITRRKNGTMKRHDGWHLIFDEDKFEDFCNRAPLQSSTAKPAPITDPSNP